MYFLLSSVSCLLSSDSFLGAPDMTPPTIKDLYNLGYLSGLDYHFARTLGELAGEEDPLVLLAAGLVSRSTSRGHVCLEMSRFAGRPLALDYDEMPGKGILPKETPWLASLGKSCLVTRNDVSAPLVMDGGGRLYLARYWDYQQRLLGQLRERSRGEVAGVDRKLLAEGLDRLFPGGEDAPDGQRLAAETSVLRHLTVVSGGPGTGKTYAVVKMLRLILEQSLAAGEETPRVFLAAPTGKAAARLQESIAAAKAHASGRSDSTDARVMAAIPQEAATVHRMLGIGRSRRGAAPSLPADVVVVDEASMVDLSLMTRLMEAIPEHARLILLGDKDQLASVEAGAILGDICRGGGKKKGEGIGKSIVQLNRSYRFDAAAGIGTLATAIRDGDSRAAVGLLESGSLPGVTFVPVTEAEQSPGVLVEVVRKEYLPYFFEKDARRKWEKFNSFRILCAHRQGSFGVSGINSRVERFLLHEAGYDPGRVWYPGRPVMVEQNDYQLNLFNGDVGVAAPSETPTGDIGVYFSGTEGGGRLLMPSRLPQHTTVYAMTVHKSQGSEFDRVVLVLPPRRSPVVTRELLYTAVTRAKTSVTILGSGQVIREAVESPVQRASGLSEQLSE